MKDATHDTNPPAFAETPRDPTLDNQPHNPAMLNPVPSKETLRGRILRRVPEHNGSDTEQRSAPSVEANGGATAGAMVPITFELLTEHYKQFEDPVVDARLKEQRGDIERLHKEVVGRVSPDAVVKSGEGKGKQGHAVLKRILTEEMPIGLDRSMYKTRLACEEAADRCERVAALKQFHGQFLGVATSFETFQKRQSEHVSGAITKFLPQDFRGGMFAALRQRSERSNAAAVEELMAGGGGLRDKYALLWEQQWKRRENLAMIGNASGIWKWMVRYLAGVPQPLLDFAKQINAQRGPTDALRVKFGGALSELARFSVELNALCTAASLMGSDDTAMMERVRKQVEESLVMYEREVEKFVQLLEKVIVNSPFFVSSEQASAAR